MPFLCSSLVAHHDMKLMQKTVSFDLNNLPNVFQHASCNGQMDQMCCSDLTQNPLRRGVRSDAQLSSTETRFQKCSQSGKNGSRHPMLSISMAFNVISCKKVERNTQKLKIADFTM